MCVLGHNCQITAFMYINCLYCLCAAFHLSTHLTFVSIRQKCKLYLSKLLNIFVQLVKCICSHPSFPPRMKAWTLISALATLSKANTCSDCTALVSCSVLFVSFLTNVKISIFSSCFCKEKLFQKKNDSR